MPLYDFRCRSCGHVFEALVRPPSLAAPACPACGAADPERQISSFAVSSPEKRKAIAGAKVARDRKEGLRDRAAMDREAEAHRREDF